MDVDGLNSVEHQEMVFNPQKDVRGLKDVLAHGARSTGWNHPTWLAIELQQATARLQLYGDHTLRIGSKPGATVDSGVLWQVDLRHHSVHFQWSRSPGAMTHMVKEGIVEAIRKSALELEGKSCYGQTHGIPPPARRPSHAGRRPPVDRVFRHGAAASVCIDVDSESSPKSFCVPCFGILIVQLLLVESCKC